MDKPRDYDMQWGTSDAEKQMPHTFSHLYFLAPIPQMYAAWNDQESVKEA